MASSAATTTEIFAKKLTKTDVRHRMAIPTRKLSHFHTKFEADHDYQSIQAVEVKVEDETGKVWNMRCAIRRENGKNKYKKPVMTGDWTRFVRSNNLGIGDKVRFYKMELIDHHHDHEVGGANSSNYVYFKIKIEKAKKLFGFIIG